jgi:hypothetical protein
MRDGDPRADNGSVLVAYAVLQWPLRGTVEDHLYSFRRHGTRDYSYVNLAVPGLVHPYALARYDAIVWHTSVLAWLRWPPREQQRGLRKRAARLRDCASVHVALPQDEFLLSDRVNDFIREFGVSHVFSVAPPSEWPKIYDGLDLRHTTVSRVLTGYLDDATVRRIGAILADGRERRIDIGYRTVPGKSYLGRHGAMKVEIADAVRERAEARGLRVDISTRAEDTFFGDDWYRFLASCRYTIGIEGGASILDRDGSVRACVENRLFQDPQATFPELEAACFPGRDGELSLFAISPRHLEACATRTAQILVEGEFGGILRPDEHYLPLRRDLSNLDQVLDAVEQDRDLPAAISDRAHREVVESGSYTYRRLVRDVEARLPSPTATQHHPVWTWASLATDTASRPLIPLATKSLMPARRRLLTAIGAPGYGPRTQRPPPHR